MPCNRLWRERRAESCAWRPSEFRLRISKERGSARENPDAESSSFHERAGNGKAEAFGGLRDEDDFADGAGLHYFFVGAGGFGERDLFADHRLERAVLEAANECGVNLRDLRGLRGPQCEGMNGSAPHHQIARSDGDVAATADHHDTALQSKELEIAAKIHVGEHLENDVDPTAAARFQDFFLIAGLAVIEGLVRSLALHESETFVGAGGAEDGEAHGAGELQCGGPDSAAAAVH